MSALDVAKGLDLMSRKTPPLACCTRCQPATPLIPTMVFPRVEFYCLECGARLGFLSPNAVEPDPELQALYERLQGEWDEHAAPRLRVGRWWIRDCEQCERHQEYHCDHATDEERAAHDAALAWLEERRTR